MASGTSNQHHRVMRLDHTQALPPEMFSAAFDFLDQPDVLCAARVSKRWRAAAVEHRNYYRVIHSNTSSSIFLRDSTGYKRLHALLRDATDHTTHIDLSFAIHRDSLTRRIDNAVTALLANQTFPLIHGLLDRMIGCHLDSGYATRVSIYDMLRHPAPILESFSFSFVDADDSSDTSSLPLDLFEAYAPRLKSLEMSDVALPERPVPALMSCHNARLKFPTISLHSLRLTEQFPVLNRLVIRIMDDTLRELGLHEGDIVFPSSLSSLYVQTFDERNTAELLRVIQTSIKRIRTLEVELFSLECQDLDLLVLFTDLAPPLRLRIEPPDAVSDPLRSFYFIPSHMALAVESGDGYIRTIHWTDDEFCGPDDCDIETYWEQFEQFSRLRHLRASVQDITVAHAFLPVVFALEELPALRCLDINLDELSGPFWMTEATEDDNDYACGDRAPPDRPTSFPPQHFAGQLYANDESGFDEIPICHSGWERDVADCALLNAFDEAEEEHMLQCPALETVVLRTSESHSQTCVSTRQLAHFGRALGLLGRAEGTRPRLRLLGVELSSAKYGKLHLQVFDAVEQVGSATFSSSEPPLKDTEAREHPDEEKLKAEGVNVDEERLSGNLGAYAD